MAYTRNNATKKTYSTLKYLQNHLPKSFIIFVKLLSCIRDYRDINTYTDSSVTQLM